MNNDQEIPDFSEIGKQRGSTVKYFDLGLVCYGCAHSIGGRKFPSGPSGERPCFFCVRNPNREKWQADQVESHGKELREWYDGSPIAFYPMDAYQPIDMIEQQRRWEEKAEGKEDWNEPKGGLRLG